MKKFLLILFFTLFISATPDSENLNITIERKEESTVVISWNVLYEEFDTITLNILHDENICLLYTSPSPRDMRRSRMPSSA